MGQLQSFTPCECLVNYRNFFDSEIKIIELGMYDAQISKYEKDILENVMSMNVMVQWVKLPFQPVCRKLSLGQCCGNCVIAYVICPHILRPINGQYSMCQINCDLIVRYRFAKKLKFEKLGQISFGNFIISRHVQKPYRINQISSILDNCPGVHEIDKFTFKTLCHLPVLMPCHITAMTQLLRKYDGMKKYIVCLP